MALFRNLHILLDGNRYFEEEWKLHDIFERIATIHFKK